MSILEDLILSEKRRVYREIINTLTEHECEIGRFVNGTYKTHKEINLSRETIEHSIWNAMFIREVVEHKHKES